MVSEERLQILDMIAQGKITAQQGIELLNALGEEADLAIARPAEEQAVEAPAAVETPPAQAELFPTGSIESEAGQPETAQAEGIPAAPLPSVVETVSPPPAPAEPAEAYQPANSQAIPATGEDLPETPSFDPRAKKWRGWWRIPLWIGVIATVLTGLLLYSIYSAAGFSFWFACAWFPFMLSVAVVALAWASRSAHWLHVRVHQAPGERPQNIAISLPVPLSLMGWFLRTFRSKIPTMQGVNPEEMILALNHVTPDKPFYVEVNEADGERVEVYIG